jgi:hypothetical protein
MVIPLGCLLTPIKERTDLPPTYLCMDANLQGFSGNRNYTPRSLLCNPLDYEKNLKHNITHIKVKHDSMTQFCVQDLHVELF